MKRFWTFAVILLITVVIGRTNAQTTRSVLTLTPVSGQGFITYGKKASIAARIFTDGLWNPNGDYEAFAVYDLGGKYTHFEAWIGIPDGVNGRNDDSFSVRVDGAKLATSDTISSNDKPIHVEVDISGAQSLRLWTKGPVIFADPVLTKGSLTSGTQPSGVASLVGPKDGVKVTSSSVSLLWEPVDGATSYGVEIVCTKGTSPHIYSMNATDSTAKFDVMGVPNGEYHWSVIAFDDKGVMGKFSKDRTFIVAR